MTYRGTLTKEERSAIQALLATESVRGIARALDLPYGKVRRYVESLDTLTLPEPVSNRLKVLFLDIENGPMEFYSFKAKVEYLGHWMLKAPNFIVSWSAKWYQEPEMFTGIVTPEEAVAKDDSRIVEELLPLIREADLIIGHNVDRHDIAKIRGRASIHGLPSLGVVRTIDTLKIAKRDLGFEYNGMDALCQVYGIATGKKIGMHNWIKILETGDEEALRLMKEYNQHDVTTSEELFDRMKPYATRISRLVDGPAFACPFCGAEAMEEALKPSGEPDYYRTQVSTYKKWICGECGKESRSKTLAEKRHPLHPL